MCTSRNNLAAHWTARRILAFCLFGVDPFLSQMRDQHATRSGGHETLRAVPRFARGHGVVLARVAVALGDRLAETGAVRKLRERCLLSIRLPRDAPRPRAPTSRASTVLEPISVKRAKIRRTCAAPSSSTTSLPSLTR